ncbi:MAG: hypothetical protein BGO82_08560 [Devosia sp. 67-54]|nr:MAG: hypothetical protein BGO82_08560 [Devosia sp. 67-54]
MGQMPPCEDGLRLSASLSFRMLLRVFARRQERRLAIGLIALDQGPLTVPQVFEGLAAYRRAIAILYGRREELRPWGVE